MLLLDDVLSELDSRRQEYIIENLKNMQIIITCTGFSNPVYNKKYHNEKKIKFFSVSYGKISVNNQKNVL